MSQRENQITGASYILNFYGEVENLLREVGIYAQLKIELSTQFSNSLEKMPEESRKSINQAISSIRYYMFATRTRVKSLRKNVDVFQSRFDELDKVYKKCYDEPLPSFTLLEEYSDILHELFVSGIAGEILVTSQKIYSDLTQSSSGGTNDPTPSYQGPDNS